MNETPLPVATTPGPTTADPGLALVPIPLPVIVCDARGVIGFANPAALAFFADPEPLTGRCVHDPSWRFLREDGTDLPDAGHPVTRAVAERRAVQDALVGIVRKSDGATRWALVNAYPEIDGRGDVCRVVALFHDVTALQRAEPTLQRLNRALRLLSQCNGLLVHAEDETRLLARVCRLIVETGGYRMAWVGFAEPDGERRVVPVEQHGFEAGYLERANITWADTERGRGPTGTAVRTGVTQVNQNFLTNPRMAPWRDSALQRGYQSSIALPLREDGRMLGALTIYSADPNAFDPEEVTLLEELAADLAFGIVSLRVRADHARAEQRLLYLAHHDALTNLPNRLLLRRQFDDARAAADRGGHGVALFFLDIDNFKEINDSFGHDFGDRLLLAVVGRLNHCLRETDVLGLYGGDQFTMLLPGLGQREAIERFARQLLDTIAEPFDIDGYTVDITASVGIALYPADGVEFDDLLKQADTAVSHAKNDGRNTFQFYSRQMHVDAMARVQMQARLRQALRAGELRLHYQPQVDLATGCIVGAEALLRWQPPGAPAVAPAEFIAVAEQSGLIIPIGEWVLNEACLQARAWAWPGAAPVVVAVNLSALQFRRGNLLDAVAAALERAMLPAEQLEVELTESMLLQDTEAAIRTLSGLKKMGVRLSIDDFGTGYSSLAYLKRLALDKIKIAQPFVNDVVSDGDDAAIVRAIIQLGHMLQLSVIAEGVETDEQLAFLKAHGCDEVQGFLLGRPMAAEEFVALLEAGGPARATQRKEPGDSGNGS
jgi:diguanylate cyclase (GGDEF)-like protein